MTFSAAASQGLAGPEWLTRRRSAAWERFAALSLPSEDDELWKYSQVERLDLDSFAPPTAEASSALPAGELIARAREIASLAGDRSALVVTVDGVLLHVEDGAGDAGGLDDSDGVLQVHSANSQNAGSRSDGPANEPPTLLVARDAFDELHTAFVADIVHVEIAKKSNLTLPVVVVHLVTAGTGTAGTGTAGTGTAGTGTAGQKAPALFPHLYVHVGTSAEAKVVEVITGVGAEENANGASTGGLVLPVTELDVSDDARLSYSVIQLLPDGWRQLGVQSGRVGRDASLRCFCASLGASESRLRADAELIGEGGEAVLAAGYLGTGSQLHDLRTVQDHVAPRTHSQLLCMGAVTDLSRSAYVGLTRVRHGAHGADAFQTNRNLVLSEGAHADSVPTLDIQENDVRCSHASTVGPIDEDQRYYLESRGIDPAVAERLIVLGFFSDLAAGVPIGPLGMWFVKAVSDRLAEHVPVSERADHG